jgi:hypothetical protein
MLSYMFLTVEDFGPKHQFLFQQPSRPAFSPLANATKARGDQVAQKQARAFGSRIPGSICICIGHSVQEILLRVMTA